MFEISIKANFCGAHCLKGYSGPCANLHGHNWEVEIFMRGSRTGRVGMLVDFKELKIKLNAVLDKLDHRDLNTIRPFRVKNPTAENIARYIFDELHRPLSSAACRLDRVRVSESPGTSAYYSQR
jgi:6-pyruvoyltetrahydropterin/6-carboxytetrahydropterin synthase